MSVSVASVTAVEIGTLAGAALGATISGISGGNPLIGALTGAIAGGLFAGAGNLVQTLTGVTNVADFSTTQLIEASLIHAGAGAISGAANAGITGGNVGFGALTAAISAGAAEGIGGEIAGTDWFKQLNRAEQIFAGLVSNVGIGAVTGGVTSEIVCGQFLHGFGQGAWTAAYGFLFNHMLDIARIDPGPGGGGSWNQYTTINPTDPQADVINRISNALGLALCVGAVVYYAGPYVLTAGLLYAPQINQLGLYGVDFANGYLPGTPPPSWPGYFGSAASNF